MCCRLAASPGTRLSTRPRTCAAWARSVQLTSQVGDDELVRALLACSARAGLGAPLMPRSETCLTGASKATVCDARMVICRLVEPVAWAYLQHTPEVKAAVRQTQVVVYGSKRGLVRGALPMAAYKVFDVNLRPPHYSREGMKYMMCQPDLVKLSAAELRELAGPADRLPQSRCKARPPAYAGKLLIDTALHDLFASQSCHVSS